MMTIIHTISGFKSRSRLPWHLLSIAMAVGLFFTPGIHDTEAAFTLNFKSGDSGGSYTAWSGNPNFVCHMSWVSDQRCARGGNEHDDTTPMFQRLVSLDPGDGGGARNFFHVIVGDVDAVTPNPNVDGFLLEYFIETGTSRFQSFDPTSVSSATKYSWQYSQGTAASAGATPYDVGGNGSFTSTATGNPERVAIRMILDDGVAYTEFLKDTLSNKPVITQNYIDGAFDSRFTVDMSAKTYADATPITAADFINTITVTGEGSGNYDRSNNYTNPTVDSTHRNILAGAYTYTAGTGVQGGGGTYSYYEADGTTPTTGFQPFDLNWSAFCDTDINYDWATNTSDTTPPLGGPKACQNADGSGGGRGGGRRGW